MKFLDWYVKIALGSALIGASMEFFMIKTGFYDKVTVLESEKRAWENSPEAQKRGKNPKLDGSMFIRKKITLLAGDHSENTDKKLHCFF
ncbi:PREDICTED: LOC107625215 isoform [Prunus dulcis]|uniref:PREDICTED: LOC107625215 isoform n=1 Tax=Prunus dulcis TaxID=3755 RepID=A0A5E4EP74_PRUDU|nr:PREDICTED: LOC107625215 isoform [Prunus dulcis]